MATIADRYLTALGPIKMEVMSLTAVTDADTVTTLMQNPSFGLFSPTTDAASVTLAINLGFSGKTVTINSSELAAEAGTLIVFGF